MYNVDVYIFYCVILLLDVQLDDPFNLSYDDLNNIYLFFRILFIKYCLRESPILPSILGSSEFGRGGVLAVVLSASLLASPSCIT